MYIIKKIMVIIIIILITMLIQFLKYTFPTFFKNFGAKSLYGGFDINSKWYSGASEEVKRYKNEERVKTKKILIGEIVIGFIFLILLLSAY